MQPGKNVTACDSNPWRYRLIDVLMNYLHSHKQNLPDDTLPEGAKRPLHNDGMGTALLMDIYDFLQCFVSCDGYFSELIALYDFVRKYESLDACPDRKTHNVPPYELGDRAAEHCFKIAIKVINSMCADNLILHSSPAVKPLGTLEFRFFRCPETVREIQLINQFLHGWFQYIHRCREERVLLTPIPGNSKSCRDYTSEEVITNTRSYLKKLGLNPEDYRCFWGHNQKTPTEQEECPTVQSVTVDTD